MVLLGNLPAVRAGLALPGRHSASRCAPRLRHLFSLFTDGCWRTSSPRGARADMVLESRFTAVCCWASAWDWSIAGAAPAAVPISSARILNHYRGVSISQAYLLTDGLVVLASRFRLWLGAALYGLIVIYVSGLAAELVSEGNSLIPHGVIVTNQPHEIATGIFTLLERGVTILPGTGGYQPVARHALLRADAFGDQPAKNHRA